jgi:hypothetical protein
MLDSSISGFIGRDHPPLPEQPVCRLPIAGHPRRKGTFCSIVASYRKRKRHSA